ncbi:MAG: type IX secretion system protein PorQ [Chitinophagaceae bacterium]
MYKFFFTLLSIGFFYNVHAQTIGGNSIFNFLKLPATPQLTGLGGINVSNISNDLGLSFNNPALLRPSMHTQLTTDFNSMYAGIKNYHVMMGYCHPKLETNFAFGVHYIDYGSITQTDAAGNILGSFRPGDYVIQLSASRQYLEKWFYGTTIKFINSNYGLYRSNAIAMDAGVAYYDSSLLLQASLLLKNMGVQLKKYDGTTGDDLPFDIEMGITKRLENAPIQFSITAQHLHQFDIRYNDTSFNNDNGFNQSGKNDKFIADKIFRHFVVAVQFYVGDYIEITTAYNHLRRSELNIYNSTNGLNGFSLGLGALFKKMQIRYARAYYQNNTAYNQFGINLSLNEYIF